MVEKAETIQRGEASITNKRTGEISFFYDLVSASLPKSIMGLWALPLIGFYSKDSYLINEINGLIRLVLTLESSIGGKKHYVRPGFHLPNWLEEKIFSFGSRKVKSNCKTDNQDYQFIRAKPHLRDYTPGIPEKLKVEVVFSSNKLVELERDGILKIMGIKSPSVLGGYSQFNVVMHPFALYQSAHIETGVGHGVDEETKENSGSKGGNPNNNKGLGPWKKGKAGKLPASQVEYVGSCVIPVKDCDHAVEFSGQDSVKIVFGEPYFEYISIHSKSGATCFSPNNHKFFLKTVGEAITVFCLFVLDERKQSHSLLVYFTINQKQKEANEVLAMAKDISELKHGMREVFGDCRAVQFLAELFP